MIQLGDKIKDRITGLTGIAISKIEYLNGCVQYGVCPKLKKGATEIVTWTIDKDQLIVIEKKNKPKLTKAPGGPTLRGSAQYK